MSWSRPHLLWFGQQPAEQTCVDLEGRNLLLKLNPSATPADYSTARAIVIALGAEPQREDETRAYIERLQTALCHGLVCTVLAPLSRIPSVENALRAVAFRPQVTLWTTSRESQVPEMVARAEYVPEWSDNIDIKGDERLRKEDRLLLRRAFRDCVTVHLAIDESGRSADVFRVYAQLRNSRAGRLPLPFFAKFDRYPKIKRELNNYYECTTLFIPFNQRPNLDPNRCVLGAERGLIVGNFIEESESLGTLVERGTARAAIHSLFGGALRGWRTQAYFDDTNTVTGSIAESLRYHLPSRLPQGRSERLVKLAKRARDLGATLSPEEVERILMRLPPVRHRQSMIHGDLHGANVRVYRDESILIDFASTQPGPLVADPAALDVALAMDSRCLSDNEWKAFVSEVYELPYMRALPHPRDPGRPDAHLWNSVRQLRQIALADQLSDLEYATAVAIHLLRRASYPKDSREAPGRREIAFVLAERIAKAIAEWAGAN